MRVLRTGAFAVLTLPLAAAVLAQLLPHDPTDLSRRSSPQVPAAAQTPPQAPAESAPSQPTPLVVHRGHAPRQTPCWRVVGIAPDLVNQRWHIEDHAKGKVSALCSDPSLTSEKRVEMIRQINEQAEQEVAKIIPEKQLVAFKACQAERDQEKAKRQGATAQKELGPCGGVIPTQPGDPKHSHEHQPNNPPNP